MASSSDDSPSASAPPKPRSNTSNTTDALTSTKNTSTTNQSRQTHKVASPPNGASDGAVETSTYGTRSRNRTSNVRPNYAEDQDADFDFVSAATTTTVSKKKQAAIDAEAAAAGVEPKRALEPGRSNTGVASAKESTPASNGSGPISKKRKAAGTSAAPVQGQTTSTLVASAASRKAAAAASSARETYMMTFSKHKSRLNAKEELIADDGTKFAVNDHVYLVCEPPGDPYYLCRIMEFLHVKSDDPSSPVDALRVNWYYRPRDVQRFNNDYRLLYGTMHSDICPLTSLRGKCTIKHRSEIADLDAYRKESNSFYFIQVVDRFIRRWYECIPVSQIINVPEKVKKALDERWKFVIVETGRVKELTSAVKTCKRCAKYCASHDSVDCAICKNSYHMNCVQPPLPKKPSRGFAWACGPCSRASERKLEQRNTPNVSGDVTEAEEEEAVEEEIPSASNESTRAPSPNESDLMVDDHPATQAEITLAKMWPMRYLGIHCKVEDALQYDARTIYPRASSRLGPRHQANVNVWHGHHVELVKPAEIKRRYNKGGNFQKGPKAAKENAAQLEADREERARRPKWVQDEPPGYVARGEDYPNGDPRNTAQLLFKMPPQGEHSERGLEDKPSPLGREAEIDAYIRKAKTYARDIGVPPFGANFLDKALELLSENNYDQEVALKKLAKMHRVRDLHEPVLSRSDVVKFEEGVAKYGSEHRLIHRHMETQVPISTIIRFYYLWKKTPKGQDIWGNYGGRKGSKHKVDHDAGAQLQLSVAHDADDSAFDNDKALKKGRSFTCKFCHTTHSRQWQRAPGVSPGQTIVSDGKNGKEKGEQLILALCTRCAGLWRRYAIQWEEVDDNARKAAMGGGRAWKRKIDEELLREILAADNAAAAPPPEPAATAQIENGEPARKKVKVDSTAEPPKKKEKPLPPPKEPTPPPPPIVPSQPQWRTLPCAVCKDTGETVECANCKLTVHPHCFGLPDDVALHANGELKWLCEQCQNDRNPMVSTDYACCLCLTEETQIDLVEPPRVTHKKKTDREREKERMEKELADAMRADYQAKQLALHRPIFPREPLKRTTGKNWAHVYCAVWTPEIRFSNAKALEVAEGFQQIPMSRFEATCKLCKNKDHQNRVRDDKASCVSCFQCHTNFHVSCAFEAGYIFGFDVAPVKSSRKDQIITATLGEETGSITPAIWCKDHVIKSVVHTINEIADPETGKTALQVYVENYKQADLSLTDTVRKTNITQPNKDRGQAGTSTGPVSTRREPGTANGIAAAVKRGARTSSAADIKAEPNGDGTPRTKDDTQARRCANCNIDVTPRWHFLDEIPPREPTPPKSPNRRLSITLGEITDRDRPHQRFNQGNIRFMVPGASGRAWHDMPERFGTNMSSNAAHLSTDNSHASALSQNQKVAAGERAPGEAKPDTPSQNFLCHKCFIKRKIGPSSPPDERGVGSPSKLAKLSNARSGTEQGPTTIFDPTKPIRMPQDDPQPVEPPVKDMHPPETHAPPLTLPPSFGHAVSAYSSFTPPAPALHAGPPTSQGPPLPAQQAPPATSLPPPPLAAPSTIGHERRSSYNFTGAPQQHNPPFAPYGPPPPPSSISGPFPMFAPTLTAPPSGHLHITNGSGSPPPQAYGSPTHGTPVIYPAFPPRISEEVVPPAMNSHQPKQQQQQMPMASAPPQPQPQPLYLQNAPPGPPPLQVIHEMQFKHHAPSAVPKPLSQQQQLGVPHPASGRHSHSGSGTSDAAGGGASTSPSLNNLLH